ncbi:hypothetical protein PCC79_10235 [Propioniciclava soli]|uniref:Uncharacterized protein n=1 Tax=Propioniciclava soli TaxID=2775081 RepID=A0ABZ3C363_9ACTN
MQERAPAGVVLVVLGKFPVHVGQARPDAVLVPFQGREVDGVGEVRGQQLVALGFEAGSVCHEVGYLLIAACHALVERGIDLRGEVAVGGVVDRDGGIGVRHEAFGDRDGHGPPGAGCPFRCPAGADEVCVGDPARVGGEVEQHPRSTGAAMQQPFEVVGVLDVPGHLRRPRPQERLHGVEQRRFHDGLMRAGIQAALVADHARVVRVLQQLVERVLPQRLRRALRRRHRQQAARGQVAQ